jgi:hypothetical protein
MIEAWVLTLTLARDDIRTGAVFPDETSCVQAGEAWYAGAVDYARRKNKPRPKGWICMPTDAPPSKVMS